MGQRAWEPGEEGGAHRAHSSTRPVMLIVVAALLAVFGVSTITYAVTRDNPNAPPGLGAAADSGVGVPAPVLPGRVGSGPAPPGLLPTARPTITSTTAPPLPEVQVVPLLSTVSGQSTSGRTPSPSATPTPTPPPTPSPSASPPPTSTTSPPLTASPSPTGPTLPDPLARSGPVRVVIKKIGVDRRPIELGVTKDNALQVPDNADDLGWWTGGPTPGQVGAAVVAGHVSYNRPGVFYRLATLARGDTISVTRKDGRTAVFTVSGTKMYPKDAFPTAEVYGFVDRAALRLITCGGTFDPKTRHFEENIVVYADMTSVTG